MSVNPNTTNKSTTDSSDNIQLENKLHYLGMHANWMLLRTISNHKTGVLQWDTEIIQNLPQFNEMSFLVTGKNDDVAENPNLITLGSWFAKNRLLMIKEFSKMIPVKDTRKSVTNPIIDPMGRLPLNIETNAFWRSLTDGLAMNKEHQDRLDAQKKTKEDILKKNLENDTNPSKRRRLSENDTVYTPPPFDALELVESLNDGEVPTLVIDPFTSFETIKGALDLINEKSNRSMTKKVFLKTPVIARFSSEVVRAIFEFFCEKNPEQNHLAFCHYDVEAVCNGRGMASYGMVVHILSRDGTLRFAIAIDQNCITSEYYSPSSGTIGGFWMKNPTSACSLLQILDPDTLITSGQASWTWCGVGNMMWDLGFTNPLCAFPAAYDHSVMVEAHRDAKKGEKGWMPHKTYCVSALWDFIRSKFPKYMWNDLWNTHYGVSGEANHRGLDDCHGQASILYSVFLLSEHLVKLEMIGIMKMLDAVRHTGFLPTYEEVYQITLRLKNEISDAGREAFNLEKSLKKDDLDDNEKSHLTDLLEKKNKTMETSWKILTGEMQLPLRYLPREPSTFRRILAMFGLV